MKQLFQRKPTAPREPWNRSHTMGAMSVSISLTALILGFVYFNYNASLAAAKRGAHLPNTTLEQASSVAQSASERGAVKDIHRGKLQFGQILISPRVMLDPQQLVQALPIHQGERFTSASMDAASDALTFAAGSAGYAFVTVEPRYEINASANTVNVKFDITEGPRTYLQRVDIN